MKRQHLNAIIALGVTFLMLAALVGGKLAWDIYGTDYQASKTHPAQVAKLKQKWANGHTAVPSAAPTGYTGTLPGEADTKAPPGEQGTPFALLYIPRFGKDFVEPILEATSLNQLSDGIGHGLGTAMPGQVGNVGLAGHRSTWGHPFKNIHKLRKGDTITVVTGEASYTYRVTGHEIVKPQDVQVWAPVPNHPGQKPTKKLLTLSACHPMWSAAERYIVYAEQVSP